MNRNKSPRNPGCRTPDQARQWLEESGISAAEWARTHKVSKALVYRLLAGQSPGLRGQCHRAAVLLGLKAGRVGISADQLVAQPAANREHA